MSPTFRFLLIAVLIPIAGALDFGPAKLGNVVDDPQKQLVFVQALWRHGDRSPIYPIPNDPNTKWEGGGGGYGQLSAKGMQQQIKLGTLLRQRYQRDHPLVSPKYISSEVYFRSTNFNRTFLSAISNLIGFYDTNNAEKGVDYPDINEWPKGYSPVPVHMLQDNFDRSISTKSCKWAKKVLDGIEETEEYKALAKQQEPLLARLQRLTGENVTLDRVENYYDTLYIEKLYKKSWPTGFDESLYNEIESVSGKYIRLYYGIGIKEQNGIDYQTEVAKIRGGGLLWGIIEQLQRKALCVSKSAQEQTKEERKVCNWYGDLKYYAYSAHDSTIAALFSALGFTETNYNVTGFPHYTSCVTFELWKTQKSEIEVKLLYWPERKGPYDVTESVKGCNKSPCPLELLANRSHPYHISYEHDKFQQFCEGSSARQSSLSLVALICTAFALLFTRS